MSKNNVKFSILLQYQYGAEGKTGPAEQIKTSRQDKYFVQPAALFYLFQGRSQSFGFTLKRLISLRAAFSLRSSLSLSDPLSPRSSHRPLLSSTLHSLFLPFYLEQLIQVPLPFSLQDVSSGKALQQAAGEHSALRG